MICTYAGPLTAPEGTVKLSSVEDGTVTGMRGPLGPRPPRFTTAFPCWLNRLTTLTVAKPVPVTVTTVPFCDTPLMLTVAPSTNATALDTTLPLYGLLTIWKAPGPVGALPGTTT